MRISKGGDQGTVRNESMPHEWTRIEKKSISFSLDVKVDTVIYSCKEWSECSDCDDHPSRSS